MTTRGGKREGSGRKPTGQKPNRTFRLDDEEYQAVKQFIEKMRAERGKQNV